MMYTSNSVTFLNPIRWYKANPGVFGLLAREGMILFTVQENRCQSTHVSKADCFW